MTSIVTLSKADEARAVDVLSLAFGADPLIRWMYPEPHDHLKHFPSLIRATCGKAFENESAYAVEGFGGAALWLPPGVDGDEDEIVELIKSSIAEDRLDTAFEVFGQIDNYHPHDEPCWYLPMIGVDPAHRGAGYGSALMEHALAPCDRDGTLAYLESSNPRNISLYERHGFEVMGKIQVGSCPPVHPMLRRPNKNK